jgi:hypothetical protein
MTKFLIDSASCSFPCQWLAVLCQSRGSGWRSNHNPGVLKGLLGTDLLRWIVFLHSLYQIMCFQRNCSKSNKRQVMMLSAQTSGATVNIVHLQLLLTLGPVLLWKINNCGLVCSNKLGIRFTIKRLLATKKHIECNTHQMDIHLIPEATMSTCHPHFGCNISKSSSPTFQNITSCHGIKTSENILHNLGRFVFLHHDGLKWDTCQSKSKCPRITKWSHISKDQPHAYRKQKRSPSPSRSAVITSSLFDLLQSRKWNEWAHLSPDLS